MFKKTLRSLCAAAAVCCAALTGFGEQGMQTVDGVRFVYETTSTEATVVDVELIDLGVKTNIMTKVGKNWGPRQSPENIGFRWACPQRPIAC